MGIKQRALQEVRSGYKSIGDTYNTEQHIQIVGADTTSAPVIIILDSSTVGPGSVLIIKDEGGNAAINNITVNTEGSETIDGASTDIIDINFESQGYYNNGIDWFKI